jgi:hypothetical protein
VGDDVTASGSACGHRIRLNGPDGSPSWNDSASDSSATATPPAPKTPARWPGNASVSSFPPDERRGDHGDEESRVTHSVVVIGLLPLLTAV